MPTQCLHVLARPELIDGAVGFRPEALNLPDGGDDWWAGYVARVEATARAASGR